MSVGAAKLKNKPVILLVDMDCFYVQVERRKNPELCNKPVIVVQKTSFGEGAAIAVSYEARKLGVFRSSRVREACAKCPGLQLAYVPQKRGKADLTCYRQAGAEVIQILAEFTSIIERASIDEAYLDVTELILKRIEAADLENSITAEYLPNTLIPEFKGEDSGIEEWLQEDGCGQDLVLAVGAMVANDIRKAVFEKTGFTCSAGIAYNKMVAKLCAGMNKPNGQTILPPSVLPSVFNTTPVGKIRHLGGKLGAQLKNVFGVEYIGEVTTISRAQLDSTFGNKTGGWLYDVCRGEDNEPVRVRTLPKSIGCGKQFPGGTKLTTTKQVKHWLQQLVEEAIERLVVDEEENNRRATLMTVHFRPMEKSTGLSRCFPLDTTDVASLVTKAWTAINKGQGRTTSEEEQLPWTAGLSTLYLSASKFTEQTFSSSTATIDSLFSNTPTPSSPRKSITQSVSSNTANVTIDSVSSNIPTRSSASKSTVYSTTPTIDTLFSSTSSTWQSSSATTTSPSLSFSNSSPVKRFKTKTKSVSSYFTPVRETSKRCSEHTITPSSKKRKLNLMQSKLTVSPISQSTTGSASSRLHTNNACTPSPNQDSSLLDNDGLDSSLLRDLPPELVNVCEVCGQSVPVWEEQEHSDYHMAVGIQQGERDNGSV